jgi:hypothetical protein
LRNSLDRAALAAKVAIDAIPDDVSLEDEMIQIDAGTDSRCTAFHHRRRAQTAESSHSAGRAYSPARPR